jgi:Tol biopolymer transport system component
VRVTLANGSGTTNEEGKVRLEHLRLGTTTLAIEKRAFAADSRRITLGWGSNPLDAISLTPTGTQYSFLVTDFLSGKGIEKIEAQVEYASAYSDKEGKIKLTLAKDFEPEEFDVSIAGQNVRTEKIRITAKTTGEQKVQLVPAKQHVFISKRSGTYDVYKIDVDGKNEKVVVKGTGNEREDSAIISHPEHNIAALVSTRTGKRNQDGFLLSDLTLIEVTSKVTSVIAQSEKIQVIGWEGDRLVYVQIAAGTSAGNPKRHRLISYDYTSGTKTELASSNYFNDVMIAGGKVLFAPSSAYSGGTKPGLYRVNVDGSGQVQFTDKEVWSVSRKTYESVVYSIKNKWFELLVASGQTKSLDGAPSEQKNVVYVDIADHSKSIWTEKRDGKGALIMYEPSARKDTEKTKRSGLTNPLSWVSTSTVIFRVQTDSETADYAMSLDGGEARKVANVADTSGIESWYYY